MVRLVPLLMIPLLLTGCGDAWWTTSDQKGQRLFEAERFAESAEHFRAAKHRGAALYRAGRFEEAAAAFALAPGAEGQFNQGNALVFLGQYEAAIEAYDEAVRLRPGFVRATTNRRIARLRLEKIRLAAENRSEEASEIGADEIVFEPGGPKGKKGEPVEAEGGPPDDDQIRAIWLRGVQDRPREFLKVKFALQQARRLK